MSDNNETKPNLDNLQADIWPGLLKFYQIFYFFNIDEVPKFRPQLKILADTVITSASGAQAMRDEILVSKSAQAADIATRPQVVPMAGVNIAFSKVGMEKLGKEGLKDEAFNHGQFKSMTQGEGVGQDQEDNWLETFKNGVDGVLLICGTKDKVEARLKHLEEENLGSSCGVKVAEVLRGEDLKSRPGHEHFGFKDGISQPLLKGLDDAQAKLPNKRHILTDPGTIITGKDEPSWATDGSYMAFRMLKQFVPEFRSFVETEAPGLNYTPAQLRARLVGRWESGAPVQVFPNVDNPKEAEKNDFDYTEDLEDKNCPFAAHIRKTKPRGDLGDRTGYDIMRRGIPYGKEFVSGEEKMPEDRGLLFVCYQSSLAKGFQFITKNWINNKRFPPRATSVDVTPGIDPIMGSSRMNNMSIVDGKGARKSINFDSFVQSKGGEYFFMPSLPLLREMATV
ncbi:hypothetical protein N5P37_005747 [Trichoderma harzianum]|uniref:Dyp-type peroxidase n=1 Tax=Trichoderma harzianum CBS 226.95 TaxID=983964 RepID=A0A2T3ZTM0_TRIHA|nr:hypothetical protein M431DRAFT_11138 [Trichoderma harzianum CBS 226.95]KAK0760811.1 hypothetical protein N5P37_005747 [Trichoderma harzianum]PKK46970.1 hypothetical protein CI102_10343 [Trichoderma harzianum]PTB48149.1 hypothetical protein M431DRAFT_11138 [Trichoderma harzianum CBS 226.95]